MDTQVSQVDDGSGEGQCDHDHDHDDNLNSNLDCSLCQSGVVDDTQMDLDTSTLVGDQGSIWDVEDEVAG